MAMVGVSATLIYADLLCQVALLIFALKSDSINKCGNCAGVESKWYRMLWYTTNGTNLHGHFCQVGSRDGGAEAREGLPGPRQAHHEGPQRQGDQQQLL